MKKIIYHKVDIPVNTEFDILPDEQFEPYITKKKYTEKDEYTSERKKLHERIIRSYLKSRHTAILIGGGSGAGKSSAIETFVLPVFKNNYVLIDADKIKDCLPEYEAFKKSGCWDASDYVHAESSDIAKMLIDEVIKDKRSFIYDGTMSNYEKYISLIDDLRKYDYHIYILFIDTDVEIALARVKERFMNPDESIGRYVSEEVVRETNFCSTQTFLRIFEHVDGYTLINNDDKPIPIFTESEILEPDLFNLFLEKASE